MGIVSVSYMIDNPFGPRRDPGWRLYMKNIPHYDLHVVQRDKNILDYRDTARATSSRSRPPTSRPSTSRRPPAGPTPTAIAASPSSARPTTTARRSSAASGRNSASLSSSPAVSSGEAPSAPKPSAAIYRGHGELFRDDYRKGIWRSKINLSFLTHSNQDEFVHKSFEIAGCGGFLLAERSPGHLARFKEDEEAVFF